MAYSRVEGFHRSHQRRGSGSTDSGQRRETRSGSRAFSELSLKRRRSLEDAEARLLASLSGAAEARVDEDNWERFAGFSVGLGSLYMQDIIAYPFVVIRRQCQVNHGARRYHLFPFTILQIMGRIHRSQGFKSFWKGWGCSCIVQGIIISTEICISKLTSLPRELARQHVGVSIRSIIGHRILKSISLILTIPFQSACLVDSIQSLQMDESRSIISVLKDAMYRLFGYYNSRGHGRLLPIYLLIAPSLVYSILHYSIKSLIEYIVTSKSRLERQSKKRKDDLSIDIGHTYYTQVYAHYFSSLLTDILLYPLETVVMRLHVQGTRTIIDDTDNGRGVVPLCTNYEGLADCFESMHAEEGKLSFFKGFGSLIIQYSLNYCVVRLVRIIFNKMTESSRRRHLEFKTL